MARGALGRTVARTVLPHRLHLAARVLPPDPPEQAAALRSALPRQFSFAARTCARSQAPGSGHRIDIKTGALWHQLNKWNLTFKKTLHASAQEREDVQAARLAWSEAQAASEGGATKDI